MERPNTIPLARCSSSIRAQGRETGTGRGPFLPRLKPRGFLALFCNDVSSAFRLAIARRSEV
jgi:hypothetical protein